MKRIDYPNSPSQVPSPRALLSSLFDSLSREPERDVIPIEKPNIIQRIVGKKHLDPAVREKKMTAKLDKGRDAKREGATDSVTSHAKILVVEDNELVQKVMRSLLSAQLGYPNVIFAPNGAEGVAMFETERPDIIFMV